MVRHLQPISQVMVVTGSLSSGRRDELVYPPIEQLIQNQLLSPRRTPEDNRSEKGNMLPEIWHTAGTPDGRIPSKTAESD